MVGKENSNAGYQQQSIKKADPGDHTNFRELKLVQLKWNHKLKIMAQVILEKFCVCVCVCAVYEWHQEWKEKQTLEIEDLNRKNKETIDMLKRQHEREKGTLEEKLIEFETYLNKDHGGNLVFLERELASVKMKLASCQSEKDDFKVELSHPIFTVETFH